MIRRTVTILMVRRRHSNPRLKKPLSQLDRRNTRSHFFKEVLPTMKAEAFESAQAFGEWWM